MAVHHLGVVAGDRARGPRPCLLGMVALKDLEAQDDQGCHQNGWPGWRGHKVGRRVMGVAPQDQYRSYRRWTMVGRGLPSRLENKTPGPGERREELERFVLCIGFNAGELFSGRGEAGREVKYVDETNDMIGPCSRWARC